MRSVTETKPQWKVMHHPDDPHPVNGADHTIVSPPHGLRGNPITQTMTGEELLILGKAIDAFFNEVEEGDSN